jgi:hypothetical protein
MVANNLWAVERGGVEGGARRAKEDLLR